MPSGKDLGAGLWNGSREPLSMTGTRLRNGCPMPFRRLTGGNKVVAEAKSRRQGFLSGRGAGDRGKK